MVKEAELDQAFVQKVELKQNWISLLSKKSPEKWPLSLNILKNWMVCFFETPHQDSICWLPVLSLAKASLRFLLKAPFAMSRTRPLWTPKKYF